MKNKTSFQKGHKGYKFWFGKKIPESAKEKMRLAKLGKPRVGNPENWKHTEATKKKVSISKKGTPAWNKGKPAPWASKRNALLCGDKSPVWKGGVTSLRHKIYNSAEYKLWRKAVFARDNYTCIWCSAKSGNGVTVVLNADHIKPFALFPELRFAIDNGRTLCVPCHQTTDTFGGRMNRKEIKSKYQ